MKKSTVLSVVIITIVSVICLTIVRNKSIMGNGHSIIERDVANAIVPPAHPTFNEPIKTIIQHNGSPTDGGKWVCNPWLIPFDCVIMSLGVSGDSSFEQELQTLAPSPCKVYGFDSSARFANTYKNVKNGKFFNYKIQAKTNKLRKEYSIQEIAHELSVKRVDIFKIDIESSEFAVIPTLFEQRDDKLILKIPICQLLVELHRQGKVTEWSTLLRTIEKAGFVLFQREANTHCQPACFEYAWIHKDCLSDYHVNLPLIFSNF